MNLVIPKQVTVVELKNGKKVYLTESVQRVQEILNSTDYILLGDLGFSKYEVKYWYKQDLDDVDQFIYAITDKVKREKLREIKDTRDQKGFKTNGTNHLLQIYEDKYGAI